MNKTKMIMFAGLGSLVSVLIWSFIGGCHTAPEKPKETSRVEPASLSEEMPPAVETEETVIEEMAPAGEREKEAVVAKEEAAGPKGLPAPPAPEAAPAGRVHTVGKGDTLWAISREYDVSVQKIQEANSIDDPGRLTIGQKIRIP
ncbi:MAG: LysM peptidoglycan-binding domain-containing protein [PVC group bacterium]